MPYNPQAKHQSNLCAEILAKFVKHEELQSFQKDSIVQNQSLQIAQGKWEDEQNLKFTVFIDFHTKIFSSKQRRKSQKIFKILSNFLGNRTPAQCRSHYQKVIIKFKTIAKLKKHFKQYFGEQLYNTSYKQFVEQWKQMKIEQNVQKSQKEIKDLKEIGIQTQPLIQFQQNVLQTLVNWQIQQWLYPLFFQSPIFWNNENGSCQ